jgi:hypothetical protein
VSGRVSDDKVRHVDVEVIEILLQDPWDGTCDVIDSEPDSVWGEPSLIWGVSILVHANEFEVPMEQIHLIVEPLDKS